MSPPLSPSLSWGVAVSLSLGALGWGLLVTSLSHGAWGMGGSPGTAVTTLAVTRGLWSDCVTDATGVTSCVPLVSLVSLPGYLQGARALSVLGAVLAVPGLGALGASSWFGAAITAEFWDPAHGGVRLEPGPGVLLAGGGGAALGLAGAGLILSARTGTNRNRNRNRNQNQDTESPPPASPPPSDLGVKYGRNAYV
ncbi:claudin-15-like [Phaethornis superciliosus]